MFKLFNNYIFDDFGVFNYINNIVYGQKNNKKGNNERAN